MANIDPEKIKVIEQQSNQFMGEVKSLCANGKRNEAQTKAISFSKEMENSDVLKTMKKCADMMKGIMQEMPAMDQFYDDPNQHVCDVKDSI